MRILVTFSALLCLLPVAASAHYVEMRITEDGTIVPERLEIYPGETVYFVNADDEPHWVASDDHPTHTVYPGSDIRLCGTDEAKKIFDSCGSLEHGEIYRFMFTEPGTWTLHDHLESSLKATIIVAGENATGSTWGPSLSLSAKADAWLKHALYAVVPRIGEKKLNELNFIQITRSDADLEYWMRVFGYTAVFDELERDAFDPKQRADTPDEQNKVTQCHVEAHFAGRMAYRLFGFDTITESVLDTRCAYGFYHGIIEMALGTDGSDAAVVDLAQQCEQYKSDALRRALCYHAVGHGVMVYYDFNVPEAIRKCGELMPTSVGKRVCYHGAFMENAFAAAGVGVSGHTSGWSDPERPDFPCDSGLLSDDQHALEMCYMNQSFIWWAYRGGVEKQTAIDGCMRAPEAAREMCFTGMGFNMAFAWKRTLSNTQMMENCSAVPDAHYRERCVLGATFMRSTHWGEFDGFDDPIFCDALGKTEGECDAYVWDQFDWLRGS